MDNMTELNNSFDNYFEEFRKLSTVKKREEVMLSIKELIGVFDQLATVDNIKLNFLKNRERLNLEKEYVTEDDFLEAELFYIETAKNLIGQYLDSTFK